jgi:5-methylcytosine-specific restriction enzyme A
LSAAIVGTLAVADDPAKHWLNQNSLASVSSRNITDRNRPNAHDRGYTYRWTRVSREFLWRRRWCIGCLAIGVRSKATLVDHIIPHKGDRALFWSSANWQPCCEWHHNSIKPELERQFAERRIGHGELHLQSASAIALTRARYRAPVGLDGFACI